MQRPATRLRVQRDVVSSGGKDTEIRLALPSCPSQLTTSANRDGRSRLLTGCQPNHLRYVVVIHRDADPSHLPMPFATQVKEQMERLMRWRRPLRAPMKRRVAWTHHPLPPALAC